MPLILYQNVIIPKKYTESIVGGNVLRKALAAVLALLLLTGCSESEAKRSTFAMNTMISVTVYGGDSAQAADGA